MARMIKFGALTHQLHHARMIQVPATTSEHTGAQFNHDAFMHSYFLLVLIVEFLELFGRESTTNLEGNELGCTPILLRSLLNLLYFLLDLYSRRKTISGCATC